MTATTTIRLTAGAVDLPPELYGYAGMHLAMRRDAASVQTGGLAPPAQAAPASPLLQGMEEEWKRRGQWADDE